MIKNKHINIKTIHTIHGKIKVLWPTKILDEDRKTELYGLTNYNENMQIAIQKGLYKKVEQQTLMHELIHMFTMPFSVELTEHEVEILAVQIIHLMKNNPKLIKYLSEK
jgi:hypothetical protein